MLLPFEKLSNGLSLPQWAYKALWLTLSICLQLHVSPNSNSTPFSSVLWKNNLLFPKYCPGALVVLCTCKSLLEEFFFFDKWNPFTQTGPVLHPYPSSLLQVWIQCPSSPGAFIASGLSGSSTDPSKGNTSFLDCLPNTTEFSRYTWNIFWWRDKYVS